LHVRVNLNGIGQACAVGIEKTYTDYGGGFEDRAGRAGWIAFLDPLNEATRQSRPLGSLCQGDFSFKTATANQLPEQQCRFKAIARGCMGG
jgi:hypothetical protein